MTSSNNSNNGNGSGNGNGSPFGVSNPSPAPRHPTDRFTPQSQEERDQVMRSMFGDNAPQSVPLPPQPASTMGFDTPFSPGAGTPSPAWTPNYPPLGAAPHFATSRGYFNMPQGDGGLGRDISTYLEIAGSIAEDFDGPLDAVARARLQRLATQTVEGMRIAGIPSEGAVVSAIALSGVNPSISDALLQATAQADGSYPSLRVDTTGVGQMPLSEYLANDTVERAWNLTRGNLDVSMLPERDAFIRRLEERFPGIENFNIPTINGYAYDAIADQTIENAQRRLSGGIVDDLRFGALDLRAISSDELTRSQALNSMFLEQTQGVLGAPAQLGPGLFSVDELNAAVMSAVGPLQQLASAAESAANSTGGGGRGGVPPGGGGGAPGAPGAPGDGQPPPQSLGELVRRMIEQSSALPTLPDDTIRQEETRRALQSQEVRGRRILDPLLRSSVPGTGDAPDAPTEVSENLQRAAGFAQGFFGGKLYVTDTQAAQSAGVAGQITRMGLGVVSKIYDKYGEPIRGYLGESGGGGIAGSIEADILYRGGYLNYFNNAYQIRQQGLRNVGAATSFIGAVGSLNEAGGALAGAMNVTVQGGQEFAGLELPMLQTAGALGYGAYSTMRPFQGMRSIGGVVTNFGSNLLGADVLRTSQALGVGTSKAAEYIAGVAQAGMMSGVGNPFSARAGQAELLNTGLISRLVQSGYDPGAVAQLQAGNALSGGGDVSVLLNAAQQTGYRGSTAMALTSAVYGATQQRMLSGLSPRSAEKVMAMAQSAGAGNEMFALSAVSKSDQLGLGSMQAGLAPLGGLASGAAMAYAMERTGGDLARAGAMVSEMGAGGHLGAMRSMGIDDPSLRSAALYARGMTPREISAAIKAGNAKAVEGRLNDTPDDTTQSMGASRQFARQTVSNAQTFGAGKASGQRGDTPLENLDTLVSEGINFNEQLIKESRIQSGELRSMSVLLRQLNGTMREQLQKVYNALTQRIAPPAPPPTKTTRKTSPIGSTGGRN